MIINKELRNLVNVKLNLIQFYLLKLFICHESKENVHDIKILSYIPAFSVLHIFFSQSLMNIQNDAAQNCSIW